eukprot:9118743-Pyramimonas_sp.AAC.1
MSRQNSASTLRWLLLVHVAIAKPLPLAGTTIMQKSSVEPANSASESGQRQCGDAALSATTLAT